MVSLYRTLSLRYLSRRWFRAALIVASIALGVATLVATRALNETMSKAALNVSNPMAGVTDLIVSNGEITVPRALADEIAKLPGVKSVQARIFENAKLPEYGNKSVLIMGLDVLGEMKDQSGFRDDIKIGPAAIAKFALYRVTGPIPVILGKELYDELPPEKGTLQVQKNSQSKAHTLAKAGPIEAQGDAAALGGYVLIMELERAAEVLGLPKGQVNRLDIVVQRQNERQKVRAEVEKVLARRAEVRTPEEHNQSLQSAMAGMQTGFSLCGIAALVVGLFLVFNALSISVAERRHEIGILLSVGATRVQVRRLFAGEATVLGLAGSLLGIPLGLALAELGLAPMQGVMSDVFVAMDARQVEVSTGLLLSALIVGISTANAACLFPAIQASQENPAEAVRRVPKAPTMTRLLLQAGASVGMIAVGVVMVFLRGVIPHRPAIYGGMIFVLLGALLAAPFFAAFAARLMQPLVRRFLGIEWRLAVDNLIRSPGRTGLVIGALAAGVALIVQTAGTIRSNRLALGTWIREAYAADLIVTSGSPIGEGAQSLPMDMRPAQEIMKMPAVEAVVPARYRKVPYRDTRISITAAPAADLCAIERKRGSRRADLHLYDLIANRPNAVIASENFAALYGARVGDTITFASPSGELNLHVAGIAVDYSWNHGSLIMNRADFLEKYNDPMVDELYVYLKPGADANAVRKTVMAKLSAQYGLHALTGKEYQERIDDIIERLYGIAYAQQIVVILVASLGVVMALLISVLQRRREMGLLRAIGASRAQVIRSVIAEAFLMGIIGTAIGLCVGVPFEWYILQVVILEESGYLFPVYIPWLGGLIIALAAVATATLAGLGPAFFAVRQRIPEAIAYE